MTAAAQAMHRRRHGRAALLAATLVVVLAAGLALATRAVADHSVVSLVSTSPSAGNGAFRSLFLGSSADGTRVVFEDGEPLVPEDVDTICDSAEGTPTGCTDVYERTGGTTNLVSTGPIGTNAQVHSNFLAASDDASHIFFYSSAAKVPADTDSSSDVYERSGGSTSLVSTGPGGSNGNFDAQLGGISSDGTHAFFETSEPLAAADTDSAVDVYDRSGGTTTLVSGGTGNLDAYFSGCAKDGSRVFFETEESLVAGDTDTAGDVYERAGGTTSLISAGGGTRDVTFLATSGDGLRVLLTTKGQLTAGDTDSASDVYERFGGTTTRLSTGPNGGNANVDTLFQGASSDATRVFLGTTESLTTTDTDVRFDAYERFGSSTTLLTTGPSGGNGAFDATFRDASDDGKRVFFETLEPLLGTDTDGFLDVYERYQGVTTLLSAGSNGSWSFFGGASEDGTRVFFHTGDALTSADTDTQTDIYETLVKSTYVRPRGGTPMLVSLTLAYSQCGSPNRQHIPGLPYASCNPPVPASGNVTVGTPDANGAVSNGSGSVRMDVCPVPGCASPNVRFAVSASDIRCAAAVSTCGAANTTAGADYTGELLLDAPLRITDRYSGSVPQDAATVLDIPFQVPLSCAGTSDASMGSTCSTVVTANSVVPGSVQTGSRAIWEVGATVLRDGGPDGAASTTPNDRFMTEGLFLP